MVWRGLKKSLIQDFVPIRQSSVLSIHQLLQFQMMKEELETAKRRSVRKQTTKRHIIRCPVGNVANPTLERIADKQWSHEHTSRSCRDHFTGIAKVMQALSFFGNQQLMAAVFAGAYQMLSPHGGTPGEFCDTLAFIHETVPKQLFLAFCRDIRPLLFFGSRDSNVSVEQCRAVRIAAATRETESQSSTFATGQVLNEISSLDLDEAFEKADYEDELQMAVDFLENISARNFQPATEPASASSSDHPFNATFGFGSDDPFHFDVMPGTMPGDPFDFDVNTMPGGVPGILFHSDDVMELGEEDLWRLLATPFTPMDEEESLSSSQMNRVAEKPTGSEQDSVGKDAI